MDITLVSLILSIIAIVLAALSFYTLRQNKTTAKLDAYNAIPLQLQAYERLVLLCERIAVPNLISRVNQPSLSAREMQLILVESVKQEFEYNSSQQIYVSQVAWEAVSNLKDQSILIINKVASLLPSDAKAVDLNKQLLELIMSQKESSLHTIVLEALNFEAKKLLK